MISLRFIQHFLLLVFLVIPIASSRSFGFPSGLQSRLQHSLSIPRPRLSHYFHAFWTSSATQYRRLLEEQRDLLERQLRQTRLELLQVKKHYQELQNKKKTTTPLTTAQIKLYHARITALEKELQSAANLRNKLEKALETEHRKVEALQAKIKQLEAKKSGKQQVNEQQHAQEIETLRAEWDATATKNLQHLQAAMEQRMQEAVENARIAAEQEKQMAVMETTSRLTKEFQRQLEEQTMQADHAVERERVKMRKLIKALAEREKNLLQQSEATIQRNSSSNGQRLSSGKSTSKRDASGSNAQPMRGPLNQQR
ncbi:hypothetical protein MPSEU_000467900 [Mayamaea pseudoterrestris]|nr:hypothetical protein MPSEU_000467900 [Mayamaea pseudoterrestris]